MNIDKNFIQEKLNQGDYIISETAPDNQEVTLWICRDNIKMFFSDICAWRNIGVYTEYQIPQFQIAENNTLRIYSSK